MTNEDKQRFQAIYDLAMSRLAKPPLAENVKHDLLEIARIANEVLAAVANGEPDR